MKSSPAIQQLTSSMAPADHPILRLQRTVGNQAVLNWLRSAAVASAPATASPHENPVPSKAPVLKRVAAVVLVVGTLLAGAWYRFL